MRFDLTYGTMWGETRLTLLRQSLGLITAFVALCFATIALGPQFVVGAFLGFVLGLVHHARKTAERESLDAAMAGVEAQCDR